MARISELLDDSRWLSQEHRNIWQGCTQEQMTKAILLGAVRLYWYRYMPEHVGRCAFVFGDEEYNSEAAMQRGSHETVEQALAALIEWSEQHARNAP